MCSRGWGHPPAFIVCTPNDRNDAPRPKEAPGRGPGTKAPGRGPRPTQVVGGGPRGMGRGPGPTARPPTCRSSRSRGAGRAAGGLDRRAWMGDAEASERRWRVVGYKRMNHNPGYQNPFELIPRGPLSFNPNIKSEGVLLGGSDVDMQLQNAN